MRQERTLAFPYVTLDEKALAELAARLEGMAADQRTIKEAEARKEVTHYPSDTEGQYEERVKQRVAFRRAHAHYSIALADGGLSDDDWASVWERTSRADVRAISMGSEGPSELKVDVRINLKPELSSYVEVASDDLENFRAEVGWLEDYFKRYRADGRKLLSIREPSGFLGWFLLPGIGAGAILVRLLLANTKSGITVADMVSVTVVVVMMTVALWFLPAYWLSSRLAPCVVIVDTGPYLLLRKSAIWLALVVAATGVGAIVVAVWSLVSG